MSAETDPRPLIAHVMYRFDIGGLENGVVNLINHMPGDAFRHVVISLTEITDFRKRIARDDVEFIALAKPAGHVLWIYPQLFRLFRRLRPAIVHSRNLAAMEVVIPALLASVPVRIHSEHGRDVDDLDGSSKKHQWLRRIYAPFVTQFIALSKDLENYLTSRVGVRKDKVVQIYNGVDTGRFYPAPTRTSIPGCPFDASSCWLVGTVGRMQAVKDQLTLARAFVRMIEMAPEQRGRARLVMIGDGPMRREVLALLTEAGLEELSWLPGERNDVPDVLRGLDCFVLPSLAEGISNTILEAMATSLPVIATHVGGNGELIDAGRNGELVPANDPEAMARMMLEMATDPLRAQKIARNGYSDVLDRFSQMAMVNRYQSVYEGRPARKTGDFDHGRQE